MNKIKKNYIMGLMTPLTVCQHDGAAAILLNGQTTYCGEEERYLRYKRKRSYTVICNC